jgi:hypothetical protein
MIATWTTSQNWKKNLCNQSNARKTDGLIKDKQCVLKWGLMFGKTFGWVGCEQMPNNKIYSCHILIPS